MCQVGGAQVSRRRQGCGLTPRSTGAPTAGHQARPGGTRYIFASPGLAPRRRCPVSSNVRRCPTQAAWSMSKQPSCSPRSSPRMTAAVPNPSAPRSGCGGQEAVLVWHAELRVHHCGWVRPRPRSKSVQRPSLCAGWPSFGSSASCGPGTFVVGAAPNSAFKRTANSVAPWPRGRGVYHRPRGQGATLPSAA